MYVRGWGEMGGSVRACELGAGRGMWVGETEQKLRNQGRFYQVPHYVIFVMEGTATASVH